MNRTAIKQRTERMFGQRRSRADRTAGCPNQPRRTLMNRYARLIPGLALLLGLGGCVSPTPVLDEHFGDAVRQARLAQTLNPDAGRNTAPVLGMDGVAAQESVSRYEASFRKPPAVTNVINIGGVIGAPSPGMPAGQ